MSAGEGGTKIVFADTNLWLYALLAVQDATKSARSRDIISSENLVTSTQLINEVSVNLLKKATFSEEQIQELIASFYERHPVGQLDKSTMLRALSLRERYGFSFWDGMMLASALMGGAQIFYTEDMHHGLLVDNSLLLVNPFVAVAAQS